MRQGAETGQKVLIGIATTGRRDVLSKTLLHLASFNDRPAGILVAVADPDDIDIATATKTGLDISVLHAPRGLCRQRNCILSAIDEGGIVFFIDDDFLPADTCLEVLRTTFDTNPDVVMVTGRVLADGIGGAGIEHTAALSILADETPAGSPAVEDVYNGYGCNMAVRMAPVLEHGVRFDETLPNYSWLEDVDFSRRLAKYGRVVKSHALTGVHLGTKTGRSAGRPLGYSQIANPVYLVRKGTLSWRKAAFLMSRNLTANFAKMLRPEPWIDRRGRLAGNIRAIFDLFLGRIAPGRSTGK